MKIKNDKKKKRNEQVTRKVIVSSNTTPAWQFGIKQTKWSIQMQ